MVIYLFLILFLILYKIKVGKNDSYIDVYSTTCINGIFILFVYYRHLIQYVTLDSSFDKPMNYIDSKFYQFLVVMFLFYSGYGIYESIKKKGKKYIQLMPRNRIFKVWIQFAIAVTLFLIVGIIFHNKFSIIKIVLSYLGWDSLGNSNWYVFFILLCYIFTWISFLAVDDRKKDNLSIFIVTIMTFIYICIMSYFKPTYWYNTALCFPMGMWFSYFKAKIEELLYNNDKLWILSVVLCTLLLLITYKAKSNLWIYEICGILFALLIVIITMRLSIQNKILYWLGKNLFGLYILQRIPMIILKHLNVHLSQPYIYVSLCFVLMIIIGGTFNFFTKNINLKKVD